MQEKNCFKLHLKHKDFIIPSRFKKCPDVEENIYSQLLFGPKHEYYVQSDVSEEVFSLFLAYWVEDKEPKITFKNYRQFYQLSEEFQLMKDLVIQAKSNFDECEQNLYDIQFSTGNDKKLIEQKISENLDSYIEKHGKELMCLEIQTLFNIFNHPSKKLSKNNEAYELIKNHFIEKKDDNVFILIGCIEGQKLNSDNFKDSIIMAEKRFGFVPNNDFAFFHNISVEIQKLNEIKNKQENQIKNLEEIIIEQNKQINELKNQQKNLIEEQNKKIDELKKFQIEQLNEFKKQELEQKKEQDKKIEELKKIQIEQLNEFKKQELEQERKIDELKKIQINQTKQIDEIKKQQETQKEEFIKKKEEQDKQINELKKSQQERNKKFEDMFNEMKEKNQKQQNEYDKKINESILMIKKQQKENEINKEENSETHKSIDLQFSKGKEFKGIINYIKENSQDVYNEINIISSSIYNDKIGFSPKNSILFNDPNVEFCTKNESNSWICFDFKNRLVIPRNYTIRSYRCGKGSPHPRNWVIEGSLDNVKWEIIDEQKDCQFLNGGNLVHTFNISNSENKKYRYLKMRNIGLDCANMNHLNFNCIEFYGLLI